MVSTKLKQENSFNMKYVLGTFVGTHEKST